MESDEDQLQEDGADSDEKSDASGAQGEDTPPGEDASPEEGEEPRRRPTLEVIGAMRDVITPCLLLDYDKVTRNIDAMAAQARKLGVQLRPHMKSHKCIELAVLQTDGTKRCIAVATVADAELYANAEFDDIHCTALFTADKIPRMQELANRLERFLVMVDSDYHVELLTANQPTGKKWTVLLKVDVGAKRGGVPWDSDEGVELARTMHAHYAFEFEGVYAHDGQSYQARGAKEVGQLGIEAATRLDKLARRIRAADIPCTTVGLGSTPTASRANDKMTGLTELHPGNYIYYDGAQSVIGATEKENIALKIATRVIGHYPHRNQLLVDAGFTAVSYDGKGCLDGASYCYFDGHPNLRLKQLNHEVGIVEPKSGDLDYEAFPIGSLLFILPYNSCSTALMHEYVLPYIETGIVACWHVGPRGVW